MFANGYVGTAEDSVRIRRQEKERAKEREKFEKLAKAKHDDAANAGLKQFAATTSEALEHAFKNETIGLVTKAEFVKKRTTLQERLEEELKKKVAEEEALAAAEKERRRKEKRGAGAKNLSFALDDGGEEEDGAAPAPAPVFKLPGFGASSSAAADKAQGEGEVVGARAGSEEPSTSGAKEGSHGPDAKRLKTDGGAVKKKLGKDPSVMTDFLPDRDRAEKEAALRAQLKKEWQAQQDNVKSEPLHIVYSYWDGSGHRREIIIKKGDTIGAFLKKVRDQLAPEFRELRHVSVDNLMYIKEDIILPQHHSFYDLIVNKARGKSGPLFDFGVHEDIRVINDASREKNESHAGKVVERHWYDRNKHIFPASRWEIYDPEKKYETYTIYGEPA